jgi:hypothetical protein
LAILAAAVVFWINRPSARSKAFRLPGYVESASTLEQEYRSLHGRLLADDSIRRQFDEANRLLAKADLSGTAAILESLSSRAEIPLIFNNLGVIYEKLGDRARALNAFRAALARDSGYEAARANLQKLGDLRAIAAEPVTQEVERNDNHLLANTVPMERPVDAAIQGGGDNDYYRFTSPPAPRDILEIRVESRSKTLAPALSAYDSEHRFVAWGRDTREPGETLVQTMSPRPDTAYFLQVWGHRGSEGAYTLTVKALRAFDAFEPNDDIYSTRRLEIGKPIDAGIMDDRDTDYFEFSSPRSGTVSIEIQNVSPTLIPALSLFSPDRRSAGFGPDVRRPGEGLKHEMPIEEGRSYFLQVWSQANTQGSYRLMIR